MSEREKQILYINACIWNLGKNGIYEPIFRAGIETQTQRTDLWIQWHEERVGRIERIALKCKHYHL